MLRDGSPTIYGRGLTAIIGPSGTVKSTQVHCINRLVEPTSGGILFRGQDMVRLSSRELRAASSVPLLRHLPGHRQQTVCPVICQGIGPDHPGAGLPGDNLSTFVGKLRLHNNKGTPRPAGLID